MTENLIELLQALHACINALRSYQQGNRSPELAEETADYAELILEQAREQQKGRGA